MPFSSCLGEVSGGDIGERAIVVADFSVLQ
jgi:hypothetical protein